MRFLKQHETLPISNIDLKLDVEPPIKNKHGTLLPNNIRALIVGPSNCGKTNVVISLLEHPNGLKFENVYIFSKSLYQPKYEYLKQLLEGISDIGYYTFFDNDTVPSPDDARPNSVFVFDDVITQKQNHIREFFCMGRHKSIDSFYLAQTYSRVPKQLIRDNCNAVLCFVQDRTNMKHIYNDHVIGDMNFEKFSEMCNECWKQKYGFLLIVKDCSIEQGRYRKNFDTFIII